MATKVSIVDKLGKKELSFFKLIIPPIAKPKKRGQGSTQKAAKKQRNSATGGSKGSASSGMM
jgi:hypothetical protein